MRARQDLGGESKHVSLLEVRSRRTRYDDSSQIFFRRLPILVELRFLNSCVNRVGNVRNNDDEKPLL